MKLFLHHGAKIDYGYCCALQYLYSDYNSRKYSFDIPYNRKHFLILKLLLPATDVRKHPDVILKALCFPSKRHGNKSGSGIKSRHLPLLYTAGFPITKTVMDYIDEYKAYIPQFILDDQEPMLSLLGLCRKYIRAYLLNHEGGNHKNLLPVVPKLPGPQLLKNLLVFDVEPLDTKDGRKDDVL